MPRDFGPKAIPEEEVPTVKEQPERGQNIYEARDFAVEQHEIKLMPELFCRDERNYWQQEAKSITENAEKELERVRHEAVDGRVSTFEMKTQKLKQLEEDRDRKLRLPKQAIDAVRIIEPELKKGKADTTKKYVDRMLVDTQHELKMASESFEQYKKTNEGKYYANLLKQQSAEKEFARTMPYGLVDLLERRIALTEELLGKMEKCKNLESRVIQSKTRIDSLERSKNLLENNKILTDKEIEEFSK